MADKKKFGEVELITRLGLSDDIVKLAEDGKLTEDKFSESLDELWISREAAKSDPDIIDPAIKAHDGKNFTMFENGMKKAATDLGVEFEKEELLVEGKPVKAIDMISLLSGKLTTKMDDLKENAGKDNSDKVNKLERQLEEQTKQTSHFKEEFESKTTAFDELETSSNKKFTDFKITTKLGEAKSKVPFIDMTDLQKIGFDARLGSLKRELDEDGKLILTDSDGESYWNEAKTEKLNADEVVMHLANNDKLVKKNAIEKVINKNGKPSMPDEKDIKRKVHPNSATAKHNDF